MKNHDTYTKLTGKAHNSNDSNSHIIIAYVDDLTHITENKNMFDLQALIQTVYEANVECFEVNLLSINCTKMKILLVSYGKDKSQDVYIMNKDGKFIKSRKNAKILGMRFNTTNTMHSHLSAILSSVGMAYRKLQPNIKLAPIDQRRIKLQSKVQSITLYGSPIVFNKSES